MQDEVRQLIEELRHAVTRPWAVMEVCGGQTHAIASLGLEETGLAKIIRAGYKLLGLETYFTAGPKEVRAWTFLKGSKAPVCAGIIHSDFERGFIRAETISYDDFVKYGSEQACKDAGKMRSEGKDYVVKDGDMMNFLFNV